ncbi:MAG: MFS transporter [Desulfovibrio sp.]|nr:MFS transporter [Desulfovibrio sp.]
MSCARLEDPSEPAKLLSLPFLVLFFQATCCNCYIAVFYCMEQWMAKIAIEASLRGALLAVLPCVVFLSRPVMTWLLYGRNATWALVSSILCASLTLLFYPLITPQNALWAIFCLRVVQGISLGIYSCCTISLLVACIPRGQNARGFALFSLTLLLPYAILPAVGETLISLLGDEARLFAVTASLALPALITLPLLRQTLRRQALDTKKAAKAAKNAFLWKSLHPMDLGFVYLACLTFSIMTNEAIFFMKGLCQIIHAKPAYFFTTYTSTIMLIRLLGNVLFDKLPRYPVMLACSLLLAACTYTMAQAEGTTLIWLSMVYGAGLGLLYPLLAALVCDRSSPAMRPVNSNIMMTAFDLSGFLAPLIGGFIVNAGLGYRAVFISTSLSIAICGLCLVIDLLLQRHATYSA